jgi:hypothetical protein
MSDRRYSGHVYMDVMHLQPADGWVVVFADDRHEPHGFFTVPLLFWAVVVDRDGNRALDGFTEPSALDGGAAFIGAATDSDNFVCFARPAAVEADPEFYGRLARGEAG